MRHYDFAKRISYENDGICVVTEAVVYDDVMVTYCDKDELMDDCISIGAHVTLGMTEDEYRRRYESDDMTEEDIVYDLTHDDMVALLTVNGGSAEGTRVVGGFGDDAYDEVVSEVMDVAEALDIELDDDFTDDIDW